MICSGLYRDRAAEVAYRLAKERQAAQGDDDGPIGQLTLPGWGRIGSALPGNGDSIVSSSSASEPLQGNEAKAVNSSAEGGPSRNRSNAGQALPVSVPIPAVASPPASERVDGDGGLSAGATEDVDESDFDEDESDSDSEYDEEIEKHICQLHAQVENLRRESAGFKIQQQQQMASQVPLQQPPYEVSDEPLQPSEVLEPSSKRQKTEE